MLAFRLFFLFASSTNFFAEDWVLLKIDDKASVQFPAQPTRQEDQNQTFYVLKNTESTFVALRANVEGQEIKPEELETFYAGVVQGITEKSGGEIIERKEFFLAGKKGFDFVSKSKNPGQERNIYFRCLLVEKLAYVLFVIPNDVNGGQARQKFFDSLKITG